MRILVVEDEPKLNELISKTLENAHYSVDSCLDGSDALLYIYGAEYDAVVLDIMLPGKSGIEILHELRQKKNTTPVLILTAKDSIDDRVNGLNQGADDYMTKPFAFDELIARVKALIRRSSDVATDTIEIGDLSVDFDTRRVMRSGTAIDLTSKEFAILEYMARNKGIVLSRDKISQHIWNYDYDGSSNVVDVYIRYLRKKIDEGFERRLIHTVRGSGYVLKDDGR